MLKTIIRYIVLLHVWLHLPIIAATLCWIRTRSIFQDQFATKSDQIDLFINVPGPVGLGPASFLIQYSTKHYTSGLQNSDSPRVGCKLTHNAKRWVKKMGQSVAA